MGVGVSVQAGVHVGVGVILAAAGAAGRRVGSIRIRQSSAVRDRLPADFALCPCRNSIRLTSLIEGKPRRLLLKLPPHVCVNLF